MKKILCMLLCAATALNLFACTEVALDEDSSAGSAPESKAAFEESSAPDGSSEYEETTEEASSSQSASPAYSTVYPESYNERAVYYGEHWTMKYDYNDSYFNNSVFIGNSIMYHYAQFAAKQRTADSTFLGDAMFFAAPSFSMYNNKHQTADSADCALPSYKGQAMNISDAVAAMNVGSVYLSLMALNDIAIYSDGMTGIDETYKLVVELIGELKEAKPTLKIAVLSNTYLHSSRDSAKNKLNNGSISTLNIRVLDYCNENGIDFIDVSTALLDDADCLGDAFCSDGHCHLTSYAYNAWTHILRDYAAKKKEGTWVNPPYMKGLQSSD